MAVTREQKIASARAMRDEGHHYRAIGAVLGVEGSTVYKWLHPERAADYGYASLESRRASIDRARAECPTCGQPMGGGSGFPSYQWAGCENCRLIRLRQDRDLRREQIAEMWEAGAPGPVIAEALGTTPNAITTQMAYMRRDGWKLSYRRPAMAERHAA